MRNFEGTREVIEVDEMSVPDDDQDQRTAHALRMRLLGARPRTQQ